jgi:hypothetical protein
MAKIKGSVRRSQLITTYGVGAIVAVEDESFMVAGIDRWGVPGVNMHEPRLERELGIQGFVLPPASEKSQDIPVVRFPTWQSCPACKRLDQHRFFTSFSKNMCNLDDQDLVPSRFVVACANGHIADFPYFRWVHAGMPRGDQKEHKLSIEAGGTTASLRDVVISCSCGVAMSMDGAFGSQALKSIGYSCTGRRPWLSADAEDCSEVPRTLQRGASNVWFSVVRSALSIPPWSEGAFKHLNRHWSMLRFVPDDALVQTIESSGIARDSGFTVDDLVAAVRQRRKGQSDLEEGEVEPLKVAEYQALLKGRKEESNKQDFVCVPAGKVDAATREWIDRVMLVKRLREVRVLESFSRVHPPGPADDPIRKAPLFVDSPGWLPAIEVTGEGVFLRLEEGAVREWEERDSVVARVQRLNENYRLRFIEAGKEPDRRITPRLVLIHSLAHTLINQWALDSGYPAASLRERLYVSDEMTGLMMYTATTDSAGSLGGVVGQAEPGKLGASLHEAVTNAAWCSADPLCIEATAQGVDSLNLAACHACLLLPEVSCEEMNLLLDRALLVGAPDASELGFFTPLPIEA